jgi:serine protease AprX
MFSLRFVRHSALALTLVSTGWLASPAEAAHRARLGADLEQQLANGSQSIRIIVHGDKATVDALARRYNLTVRKYLKSGAVLQVTAGQLDALAQDDVVDHVSTDAAVHSSNITTETIGADQVWAGVGNLKPLSGAGVGVALIDSGIDFGHAALANRVVYTKDFTGGNGSDTYGHGTHVGALILGQAGQTADTRDYQGVAPGARLINLRVLDGTGAGRASDVIAAIDWAIDNRNAYNIRVINLSLGAPVVQSYKDDPLCEAVERAVAAGIVVVAAAGNHGVTTDGRLIFGAITSPGNDPSALTVGAVDMHGTAQRSDDTVALYSSKGPTLYDLVIKPDLVAPGSRLVSAEAAGSYLSTAFPERHVAGAGANAYMALSGTSMAAGVASGSVALLLDEKPKLTPGEVKLALQLTSSPITGEGLLTQGAGDLNVLAAISFTHTPRPASRVTTIAGESVRQSGLAFLGSGVGAASVRAVNNDTIVWGGATLHGNTVALGNSETIVWGSANTIVWGIATDTIVWGSVDTIVWGSANTIVWGSSKQSVQAGASTIIWGSVDTIIWGSNADNNTIIWGSAADTIVWGSAADTIVWGGSASDTIIWGGSTADTIVWGGSTADTIIWGSAAADTIIWGSSAADTIVWGS